MNLMNNRHQVYFVWLDPTGKIRKTALNINEFSGLEAVSFASRMMTLLYNNEAISQYTNYLNELPRTFVDQMIWSVYYCFPEQGILNFGNTFKQLTYPLQAIDNECGHGITIFDCRDNSHPKYCFMNVSGLNGYVVRSVERWREPLSGKEYLDLYFPKRGDWLDGCVPIWGSTAATLRQTTSSVNKMKRRIGRFDVMDEDACREIFPQLYS